MIQTSIIIPVRNQKKQLLLTLNSLKRQIKNRHNFEIVICDDSSDDGTGDAVRQLRFPIFLKYFINRPPLGRSANRNFGFEKSSGKNLIFLDGDMVPANGYIEAMLADSESDTVKVGGIRLPPNEKPSPLERYFYSRGRYVNSSSDNLLPGRLLASANFMIRRDTFDKVGGFDTGFNRWGGEDIDLGLRLEKMGIPVIGKPDALTYHHHKKTIRSLAEDFYNFGNNTFELLIKKHPDFLNQFPAHLLGMSDKFSISNMVYKFVALLTINKPALKLAENIVAAFDNYSWPDIIFDFVTWGNLGLGYKKRNKKRSTGS